MIEDVFSGVVPQGHIVNRTVTFHSERTSHDPSKLSKQVANSKIQDLTPNADLYRLISRTVVYGPVRTVVWAFYYPQVQAILASGLLLEYLDVRFDELLDELS